jgi:hypothetical protein
MGSITKQLNLKDWNVNPENGYWMSKNGNCLKKKWY